MYREILHLYWLLPKFVDLWYKSKPLKKTNLVHKKVWSFQASIGNGPYLGPLNAIATVYKEDGVRRGLMRGYWSVC